MTILTYAAVKRIAHIAVLTGLTLSFAGCVQSAQAEDVCKLLDGKSKPRAFLIDKNGQEVVSSIELGDIDVQHNAGKAEYVSASVKYRLILSPRHLEIKDDCSMSLCLHAVKVASRCKNASEYQIAISALPWKFGPGKFTADLAFDIQDPTSEYELEIPTSFPKRVSGNIISPWLAVQKSAELAPMLNQFFAQRAESISFKLVNEGNSPLRLSEWVPIDADFQLQSSACSDKILQPLSSCTVTITKAAHPTAPKGFHSWLMQTQDGRQSYTLALERFSNGKIEVSVKNR
jgi:hypothetical protein